MIWDNPKAREAHELTQCSPPDCDGAMALLRPLCEQLLEDPIASREDVDFAARVLKLADAGKRENLIARIGEWRRVSEAPALQAGRERLNWEDESRKAHAHKPLPKLEREAEKLRALKPNIFDAQLAREVSDKLKRTDEARTSEAVRKYLQRYRTDLLRTFL